MAAMEQTVAAVYEDGVLKPLQELRLSEHQRVKVTITLPPTESPEDALDAWLDVYRGLSEDEVAEIEAIALNRRHFMAPVD